MAEGQQPSKKAKILGANEGPKRTLAEGQQPPNRAKLLGAKEEPQPTATWRLYPPLSGKPRNFELGSTVFFRPKGGKEKGRRGTVILPPEPEREGHVWVQFGDNDKPPKKVSCKRLVPVYHEERQCLILFTPETIPYRHLACSQVGGQDDILEIGCSTGEASAILCRYGRSWVGLDSSADMIEQCSARLAAVIKPFHACKMDALSDPTGALKVANKFSGPKGPSVVFLDIGGNREEVGVMEMMHWVFRSLANLRLLVIKSRQVVKDLTKANGIDAATGTITHGSQWFQDKFKKISAAQQQTSRHPLQAPLVYSPSDPTQPICRYHNYCPDGCKKRNRCPYNHQYCHLCLHAGHRAIHCGQDQTPPTEKMHTMRQDT